MASYGNGDLKIKTLGDLRRLVKKFDDLEDDYKVCLDSYFFIDECVLTDDVDISFSDRSISITLEVTE